ncbi:hypothetical protein [Marivita sp. XM-24bin2]|jgi:hypothetical protein|uniref:hypothetical protein n=1 Tax=unclassified Marivita TaxID=2632480 RepID=UPI000D7B41E8|nr:hypothetical protein [Marivita sp. XM-24bin2]MCR9110323.1 hypothetical protein [Paracoccaceae bacterium]PWL34446.1 MAG: hypothetical protein DCO97_14480 [Marivita sp. XM-24bin2]
MTRLIAILMLTFTPFSLAADTLPEVIGTYVTDFNVVHLEPEDERAIRAIHARVDLSHGMKLLLIHEELLNAGALEHANVHGITPEPFQLSQAD